MNREAFQVGQRGVTWNCFHMDRKMGGREEVALDTCQGDKHSFFPRNETFPYLNLQWGRGEEMLRDGKGGGAGAGLCFCLSLGWIPDELSHSVVGKVPVLTSYRFQETLKVTSKGANYLQQVVIASTMTLRSRQLQRTLFPSLLHSETSCPTAYVQRQPFEAAGWEYGDLG